MHNNYHLLKPLTKVLENKLKGTALTACFTQNKNELIIVFDQFIIKAYLNPAFCCLSFPYEFHRARKNSVDLFERVINQKVESTTQYLNERCFSIDFAEGNKLLFKMHGNRSNIILISNNQVEQLFINRLSKDQNIDIELLDRPLEQSYNVFKESEKGYKALFPTFGKVVDEYFKSINYDNLSVESQWDQVSQVSKWLEEENFYIEEESGQIRLNMLPCREYLKKFSDPIAALNFFFNLYVSETTLTQEKHQISQKLSSEAKRLKNYISKSEQKLSQIEGSTKYNYLADILMANLHNIKTGETAVSLPNFYDNNELVKIKLKRDLSPQQNAEYYYKKSKNQGLEIKVLKDNIDNKILQLAEVEDRLSEISNAENLKDLRKLIKSEGLDKVNKEKQIPQPFFKFNHYGFDIYVGKSAQANDELLRNYTYKEDLWLHAKDVSGSHVIIKYKSGQEFTKTLIEKAAELAAYYSKRKNDTLCPVIYTPRKYVRKRKNDPPGAVVVEREQVVLVEPKRA